MTDSALHDPLTFEEFCGSTLHQQSWFWDYDRSLRDGYEAYLKHRKSK
jgi:hypothetical protein